VDPGRGEHAFVEEVLVRGELYYNLLWPGLVEKFSHLPEDLTAPVLIAEAETEISAP
jgi:hypothetical protein